MNSVNTMLLIRCVVKPILEIWVWDVMNKLAWITKPEIIVSYHPWRNLAFRSIPIKMKGETLPWGVAKWSWVNSIIQVSVVLEWWCPTWKLLTDLVRYQCLMQTFDFNGIGSQPHQILFSLGKGTSHQVHSQIHEGASLWKYSFHVDHNFHLSITISQ